MRFLLPLLLLLQICMLLLWLLLLLLFFCILHKLMLQPQQQTNEQTIRRTNMKLPIRHPRTTLRTCMRMSTVHTRSAYTERKNHSKYNIFGSRVLNISFIYSLATFGVLQTSHYLVTSGGGKFNRVGNGQKLFA